MIVQILETGEFMYEYKCKGYSSYYTQVHYHKIDKKFIFYVDFKDELLLYGHNCAVYKEITPCDAL